MEDSSRNEANQEHRETFEVSVQFGDDEPTTFDFGNDGDDDNSGGDDRNETSCSEQLTCGACRRASSVCHWCASDDACHVMGSVYGCLVGAECDEDNACQRTEPEAWNHKELSQVPVALICGMGALAVCCATGCLWVVGILRGACLDFHSTAASGGVVATRGAATTRSTARSKLHSVIMKTGTRTRYTRAEQQQRRQSSMGEDADADVIAADADAAAGGVAPQRHHEGPPSSSVVVMQETDNVDDGEEGEEDAVARREVPWWLSNIGHKSAGGGEPTPQFMPETFASRAANAAPASHLPAAATSSSSSSSPWLRRLHNACRCCLVQTVVLTATLVTLGILYYPRMPQYNVCSNRLDWQSIVDGMESFQLQADFSLLASVANPNRFAIVAELASGKLMHEGTYVGSLSLAASQARLEPRAITDFLVDVTFTPDKWEALSLTSQFYQGTLTLSLDAQATIRVPALKDYTYQAKYDGYVVHVNDESVKDRHLCACPDWD